MGAWHMLRSPCMEKAYWYWRGRTNCVIETWCEDYATVQRRIKCLSSEFCIIFVFNSIIFSITNRLKMTMRKLQICLILSLFRRHFKMHFLNENAWIPIQISVDIFPKCRVLALLIRFLRKIIWWLFYWHINASLDHNLMKGSWFWINAYMKSGELNTKCQQSYDITVYIMRNRSFLFAWVQHWRTTRTNLAHTIIQLQIMVNY